MISRMAITITSLAKQLHISSLGIAADGHIATELTSCDGLLHHSSEAGATMGGGASGGSPPPSRPIFTLDMHFYLVQDKA